MKRLVPLTVSVVLLAVVIYLADFSLVVATLASANPLLVVAGIGVWAVGAVLRSVRWNGLLKHVGIELPYSTVMKVFLVGFYLSNLSPGKTGDPIRAAILKRAHGKSFSEALPSIIIERILDIVAMVLIVVGGIALLPETLPRTQAYSISAVFLLGIGVMTYIISSPMRTKRVLRCVHRLFSFIPKVKELEHRIEDVSERFSESFNSYRSGRVLATAAALTGIIWILEGVILKIAFLSIGVDISLMLALTVVPLATLAGVLSLLPGGIGSSEAVGVAFFVVVAGISPAEATAATLIGRVMSYWMYVFVGSVLMGRMEKI